MAQRAKRWPSCHDSVIYNFSIWNTGRLYFPAGFSDSFFTLYLCVADMILRIITSIGCILLALALTSCSGADTVPVKGNVTFKGQPVTVGSLGFTSKDGKTTFGAEIQSDGTYVVQGGAPVGVYSVEYQRHPAETPDDEGWDEAKKYIRCAVSESFEAKVGSGDNKIDIELTIEAPGGGTNEHDA